MIDGKVWTLKVNTTQQSLSQQMRNQSKNKYTELWEDLEFRVIPKLYKDDNIHKSEALKR